MMSKSIAWVGTGFNSQEVLKQVVATGNFDITVLVRGPASDYTGKIPAGVPVTQVDYSSHEQLVQALKGKDTVIVFTRFLPGFDLDRKQIALINAAIEAGVKYFIPSEWAPDTAGSNGSRPDRIGFTLPTNVLLAPKRAVHNYLLSRAGEGKISFAAIYCGVLIETCMRNGMIAFDFEKQVARMPDGGIHPFSATSIQTLGKAVIGLLTAPEKVKNKFLHISDGVITLKDILHVVKEVTGKQWKTESFSLREDREIALQRILEGVFTPQEFVLYLRTAFLGGRTVWTTVDNEILGITQNNTIDLREEVRSVIYKDVRSLKI